MMFLIHIFTYWSVGGFFSLCDLIIYNRLLYSESLKPYKIGQINKKYIEYTKTAVFSSLKNQIMITLPFIYCVSKYIIITNYVNITFINECLKILFFILIGDVWFYSTHRLLHEIPCLYKIHKHHHRLASTCALAALDANIIEHVLILGSVAIGPYFLTPYFVTMYIWIMLSTLNVVNSHSGYLIFDKRHNIHHSLLKYNYGNGFYLMDKALGTEKK
jgi:sterol desaturase/sphingolipid hydroxylase (fatty acid hydroxylase superfamily)